MKDWTQFAACILVFFLGGREADDCRYPRTDHRSNRSGVASIPPGRVSIGWELRPELPLPRIRRRRVRAAERRQGAIPPKRHRRCRTTGAARRPPSPPPRRTRCYAAVSVSAPWIFLRVPGMIPPLLCSSNVILLLLTGIFQQYWVHQVRKVRLQGYYDFSQKLKHIARLPFATISYGTALMLLIIVWQPFVQILSISLLLRIAIVVEATCAGCFMSLYIWYIHKYNSLDGRPDILRSLYSALQPSSTTMEDRSYQNNRALQIKYYDGRLSDQQMALLQYQRENIHYLSEEVLRLQECLSKYQRTDVGNTPQVDLVHLLASRDQELRALSAEMNQVHSELQLARGLIDEKDSEIQRIRVSNNQYVEENDRLRAILGEWSSRAAKLERALEAERLSNIELRRSIAKFRGQLHKEQHA